MLSRFFCSHYLSNAKSLLLFAFVVKPTLARSQSATCSTMRVVHQEQFGDENVLHILQDAPIPEPKPNQVLVKVYATALNRADLLMRQGKYPNLKTPVTLGLEAAGIVAGCGSNSSKWNDGDKVMALLPGGGYAEYVAVNEDHVMAIPSNFTYQEAAAIPEVWLTAYQLLHFVGKAQPSETILIHGGGSGVGTAAVQLAKLANVQTIVTAGTEEKIALACKLGAAAGFNYKEGPFLDKVLNFTNGKGVDVVLDCVGGSYWKQNIGSLAFDGRWVVYGLLGGGAVDGPLLSQVLAKRISVLGTTLKARSDQYKTELVSRFSENALKHFSKPANSLRPVVDRVMELHEIVEAHQYMATNKNIGKIVINVQHA